MTVAPVTNKIKILHSPDNLGGTRIKPNNKFVALDGFNEISTPILLDEKCITSIVELRTPAFTKMKTWDNVEDIQTSTAPTSGSVNFRHTTFVILPPFIANHIIEFDTRDPKELFINCKNLMETHDKNNSGDTTFQRATDNCRHLLNFLWAASKGAIPPLVHVNGHDDHEVKSWNTKRHNNCIDNRSNTTTIHQYAMNDAVIQSLAHSIDNQTILFEKHETRETRGKG